MIARKYNSLIEVWRIAETSDGYGGSTVYDNIAYTVWANVKTKRASILQENGQRDNIAQIIFTIRNKYNINFSVKDSFIKHNGLIYNIDSILNLDLDNIDIEILASQRE
jgi:head-tail adaptor